MYPYENARLRKQAVHKAKCYCEADARSDWADGACIASCPACTMPACELSSICKQCVNEGTEWSWYKRFCAGMKAAE